MKISDKYLVLFPFLVLLNTNLSITYTIKRNTQKAVMQKLCNLHNLFFSNVNGIRSNFCNIEYFPLERLSGAFEICEIN